MQANNNRNMIEIMVLNELFKNGRSVTEEAGCQIILERHEANKIDPTPKRANSFISFGTFKGKGQTVESCLFLH